MALEENKYNHLVELGGSDYEIVDGEPNIKGWDVKNEFGQQIGKVGELLFDPQSRKVRYLVVDLDGNKLGLDEDKKVLVPIGIASLYNNGDIQDADNWVQQDNEAEGRIDSGLESDANLNTDNNDSIYDPYNDGKVVLVPVTAGQLIQLPAYKKDYVTPDTESTVRHIFEGLGATGFVAYNRDDFYAHDHFNEDRFYNRNTPPVIVKDPGADKEDDLN